MDTEGAEPTLSAPVANAPIVADTRASARQPAVVDAEFKVVHPWRLWRRLRDSWWALGPYLAYCATLWGLAALAAWLMDRSRAG